MKIISIFLALMLLTGIAMAGEGPEMSDDPRLAPALESNEKGLKDEKRGDGAFRGRPGEAQRRYEHSEHYLLTAAFKYEQLGIEHGIDVKPEVDECNAVYRRVHVKTNQAKKRANSKK